MQPDSEIVQTDVLDETELPPGARMRLDSKLNAKLQSHLFPVGKAYKKDQKLVNMSSARGWSELDAVRDKDKLYKQRLNRMREQNPAYDENYKQAKERTKYHRGYADPANVAAVLRRDASQPKRDAKAERAKKAMEKLQAARTTDGKPKLTVIQGGRNNNRTPTQNRGHMAYLKLVQASGG